MTEWDKMVLRLRFATDRLIDVESRLGSALDKSGTMRQVVYRARLADRVALCHRWLSEHNRLPEVDTL